MHRPRYASLTVLTLIQGGVGKTTISVRVCRDPRMQQAFPDGIRFYCVGREFGSYLSLQKSLIRLLADSDNDKIKGVFEHLEKKEKEAGEEAALADGAIEMEKLNKGKCQLITLDDVWDKSVVTSVLPPRCLGEKSRLLITTRKHDALPDGCQAIQVGLLGEVSTSRIAWHTIIIASPLILAHL